MSDLQNQTPADTYKGLLQVGDYTNGVDGNSEYIQDGEGTNSALSISTTKVGVGTVSPSAELDVNGNVVADEYALDGTGTSTSAVAIHAPATNELAIRTNTTERIRIDSAGNCGIGTANPAEKLTVIGDILIDNGTDSTLYIGKGAEGVDGVTKIKCTQTGTDTDELGLSFFVHNSSSGSAVPSEAMSITHTGDVGIGTTSPSKLLTIVGSTAALRVAQASSGVGGVDLTSTATGGVINLRDASGTSVIDIDARPNNDTYFNNGGNVGIGTDSPSAPLEISSNLNTTSVGDSILTVRNTRSATGTGSATIGFVTDEVDGSTADKRAQISASYDGTNGGKLVFSTHNETSLSEALTIESNGNCGIGTSNPSAPLEISSTTGGVIMPRMTTSQRTAILASDGEMVYDTDLHKFYGYANGGWVPLH